MSDKRQVNYARSADKKQFEAKTLVSPMHWSVSSFILAVALQWLNQGHNEISSKETFGEEVGNYGEPRFNVSIQVKADSIRKKSFLPENQSSSFDEVALTEVWILNSNILLGHLAQI